MIVDVHTHCIQPEHIADSSQRAMERVGYPPMQPLSPEAYARAMEVVDRSIVFGVRAQSTGFRSSNDFTAQWVKSDPEKYVGFMAIDPTEDDYLEEIERCSEDLGLRGIKMYPALASFDPTDSTVFAMYEMAQRKGLPILSHMGTSPDPRAMLKYSLPILIDEVAQAFPDMKIVIAHMAHPWQRDTALVLRKHPNVYADVSGVWRRPWQGWEALIGMVEWDVTDKLLFGSDFPLWTPQEGIEKMRCINDQVEGTNLPRVPDEVIEGIISRDSLKLLEIGS